MRPTILICCAAAIAGCARTETKTADTAPATATPAAPAPIQLGDVAGKWTVDGKNEAGDTTLVTYTLTTTGDTSGWSMKFANMAKPVPVHVASVAGDSIVIEAGPYASVLRKGVQVRTNGVMRLRDGKLVGMVTAHYNVKTADSVRRVMIEGTRAP